MSYDLYVTQQPSVGFTTPTIIYEKMRQINTSARSFDVDVQNVERDVFKKAWGSWYETWKAFFEKHQSQMQRLGNVFMTDELDKQVESYRSELLSFMATYDKELRVTGEPLPPRATAEPDVLPGKAPDEGEKTPGIHVPWWGWMLGGAALTVGVYIGIRRLAGPRTTAIQYVPVSQPSVTTTLTTPTP